MLKFIDLNHRVFQIITTIVIVKIHYVLSAVLPVTLLGRSSYYLSCMVSISKLIIFKKNMLCYTETVQIGFECL